MERVVLSVLLLLAVALGLGGSFTGNIIAPTGAVVFVMDAAEGDEIERLLVLAHEKEGVDVTVGVADETVITFLNERDSSLVEGAQSTRQAFAGNSYREQRSLLLQEKSDVVAFQPTTLIVSSAIDQTTVRVIENVGFHSFVTPQQQTQSDVAGLQGAVFLCRGGNKGPQCRFPSFASLFQAIDQQLADRGVALVFYKPEDFTTAEGKLDVSKYEFFEALLQRMGERYTFVTVEEWYQARA